MNALVAGAVLGGLGVALGAFGAHGLADRLGADATGKLAWWDTAVRYQLWQALALLVVGLLDRGGLHTGPVAGLFLAGTVVFSGSLYAMTLGAPRWFGAITPVGGLLLIAGWAALAWNVRGR